MLLRQSFSQLRDQCRRLPVAKCQRLSEVLRLGSRGLQFRKSSIRAACHWASSQGHNPRGCIPGVHRPPWLCSGGVVLSSLGFSAQGIDLFAFCSSVVSARALVVWPMFLRFWRPHSGPSKQRCRAGTQSPSSPWWCARHGTLPATSGTSAPSRFRSGRWRC